MVENVKTAHDKCQEDVIDAMRQRAEVVVVHNTFTQNWEMDPYKRFAKEWGYDVCVIRMENSYENIHNVPEDKVAAMNERFEDNRDKEDS